MQNQMEALKLIKDWSSWLVGIQTGALGLIALLGKDSVNTGRIWVQVIFLSFVLSIISAAFILAGLPSMVQRIPEKTDINIYWMPLVEGWPALWWFTVTQQALFMLGIVAIVIAFFTRGL